LRQRAALVASRLGVIEIPNFSLFSRGDTMTKGKGGGSSFRGRDAKTGHPIQIPQVKRPAAPSVPRVMPRTKASPKGR
jgi:hypothetical protein